MSLAARASASRTPTILDVVELACLAPSVHNTQPWTWRAAGSTIELYADPSRLLAATVPLGHNLVVSCGAALHHARVAALGLGWQPAVTRLPEGPDSDLLARIELTAVSRTPQHVAAVKTLRQRRTDRRRFTSWPIPGERLVELAATAERWGVVATPVTEPGKRWQVEALLARAFEAQSEDPRLAHEQSAWIDHSSRDGVPSDVIPDQPQTASRRRSRFGPGRLENADREVESADGLIVLGTVADDRASWLRAGEALGALWLHATSQGLSVVPLSQPIEVPETRMALQREVLVSLAVSHVLLRIGWPAISRTALPAAPRRPVAEVLRN